MLDYIVKVLLFQTLFLAIYDLILKRETFFQWNRYYLIITSFLAYLIPLIKLQSVAQSLPQEYVILLPEVVLSPQTVIAERFDWWAFLFGALQWLFWIGVVFAALLFLVKLNRIFKLIRSHEIEQLSNYSIVYLNERSPFSFFRYIFLNKSLSDEEKTVIIAHELVHIKQRHSLDLLFFELQRIVFWFNPFSYLYQSRLAALHEFIADAKSIKNTTKGAYFESLLNTTFGTHTISFINPFFKHSLIKKRIVMLNKERSKDLLKFKYLLLLPLLVAMLIYSSCETNDEPAESKNNKRFIILHMGGDGVLDKKEIQSKKEGYFDMYMFGAEPIGKEIAVADLTTEEKEEFDRISAAHKENREFYEYTIYEMSDGKRAIKEYIDFKRMKASWNDKDYSNADLVPFAKIEKTPVYPGCENAVDRRKCFIEKVNAYIKDNFDMSMANTLNLEKGKKKIYVQFTIDSNGIVSEVRARAPHIDLEDEAMKVIRKLPEMKPSEHNGRKVAVKYTVPISFVVE